MHPRDLLLCWHWWRSYNYISWWVFEIFNLLTSNSLPQPHGCDLDWEFPNRDTEHPEDRTNFSMMVKEISASFKEKGLLLTAAIGAEPKIIDDSYEIDVISKHLDYLHDMCFDYHGLWTMHSHDSHNVTGSYCLWRHHRLESKLWIAVWLGGLHGVVLGYGHFKRKRKPRGKELSTTKST